MVFLKIIFCLVVIYSAALAGLFFLQRKILYHPERFYTSLAEAHANPAFREMTIHTDDGLDIKMWHAPVSSQPLTVVFFHGNGDSLRTVARVADPYIQAGYGFLATEYRGYSGMPGDPDEAGLYADARAAIRALIASGVPEKQIVLFGYSLGTGVAIQMATEFHVSGIILAAPYLSIGKVAQAKYPIFPAERLVKDRFDNFTKIKHINVPLLIVHGLNDAVVPVAQGEELFTLANEPKLLRLIPNTGHNDLFVNGVWDVSLAWLAELPRK